jgi:hypothetical protein
MLNEHVENLALVVDGHRYIRFPAIRTTISSRCQRALGPAPHCFIGDVEPTLGEQFLRVSR